MNCNAKKKEKSIATRPCLVLHRLSVLPPRIDKYVIAIHPTGMVTVVLTPDAARDIEGLPAPIVARMARLVDRLGHWPDVSGVKALRGDLAGHYRLRTGDYRLQFRVRQT